MFSYWASKWSNKLKTFAFSVIQNKRCDAPFTERTACEADGITQADCEAMGCCFSDTDTDSPFQCWQPEQGQCMGKGFMVVFCKKA